MKKYILFCFAISLISCNNTQNNSMPQNINNPSGTDTNYSDTSWEDSLDYTGYNPDEYGICEGLPEIYEGKNDAEIKLIESLQDYFTTLKNKDVEKSISYICPKMISITSEKFPDYSEDEIKKNIAESLFTIADLEGTFKERFEGYKKSGAFPTKIYKLDSKEGTLLYSVHYSILIICTDGKNYYGWHMPGFVFAGSYDNGKKWYLIENAEDVEEVLSDFRK